MIPYIIDDMLANIGGGGETANSGMEMIMVIVMICVPIVAVMDACFR